ncbi:excinuclease ABC, A subunit [Lentisphaera araneosa HTCC2155]|uniref:UvrABC system protein A n=1 Tax=Lentisphaera araneosa HTCC2155 TaxID=313628 RepID=A6DP81_9BACT|nr:excinuclease ABC subunit UvrA [Lentisphaera araneosa]EDM26613.1 excinuclease ABC, A subunit [Lentisphaera araneosa HTCC2155]
MEDIFIKGARHHNLKNVDVRIPRNKLVVVTGLSGSGKSSLAFDTLYAEGQRRYVESLSSYARQFMDQMEKPEVEQITGLSPAIAIEQRGGVGSPRSIVATSTEIYDYLRLMYAHVGKRHCPQCGERVQSQSAEAIVRKAQSFPEEKKMLILSPLVEGRKGEHKEVFEKAVRDGFARVRVDGEMCRLEDVPNLDKNFKHNVDLVVDRIKTGSKSSRLTDSVETALTYGGGSIIFQVENEQGEWDEHKLSEHLACDACNISFSELQARDFSFNSPYGACGECHGLGSVQTLDIDMIVPDKRKPVKDAFPFWKKGPRRLVFYYKNLLESVGKAYDFELTTRFEDLSEKQRDVLLYGTGKAIRMVYKNAGRWYDVNKPFEGVARNITRRMNETGSDRQREKILSLMVRRECGSCHGDRLKPESLAVTVKDMPINHFLRMSIADAAEFIQNLDFNETEKVIAGEVSREIDSRLGFLNAVGLNYLNLNRESSSLSGGEAQRIRLATQLGAGLVGVLYILDEPSIGLHQRDNDRLLATLEHLRGLGNTVVVVEHDTDTILRADYLIDMGPMAGRLGGEIVFAGPPKEIMKADTLTGQYMSGKKEIAIPAKREKGNGKSIKIKAAAENNLQKVNVSVPLGKFVCVTGVSGSGKSTLVHEILKKSINKHLGIGRERPGKVRSVEGLEEIDKQIVITQSPIGKTPRSNPATYTGAFDQIRTLYASTPDAKARAYKPGRFSFNVKGGRCEECKGDGYRKIEMNFLPDVFVECEVCRGRRYNTETLSVLYKGRSIADVLEMTIDEAYEFFDKVPKLKKILGTLEEVGLGYLHMGQAATTLSGGEAQRVKLASELCRIPRGHTMYILDEPTTGLHIADIDRLLQVLHRLRDAGNSLIVIEHNLDVIKTADWIIDMGPEGGAGGGQVMVSGTPEKVAKCAASFTGQYLKPILK